MPSGQLVETIYGKSSKYEVYKVSEFLAGTKFKIYKNEKLWKRFSQLDRAVEEINKDK